MEKDMYSVVISLSEYQSYFAEKLDLLFKDETIVGSTTSVFDCVTPVYSLVEAAGLSLRVLSAVDVGRISVFPVWFFSFRGKGKSSALISFVSWERTSRRASLLCLDDFLGGRTESTSDILLHIHNVINKYSLFDTYKLLDLKNLDDFLERKHYAAFSASYYLGRELRHEKLQDSFIAIGDDRISVNNIMKSDSLSLVHKVYPVAVQCNFIDGDKAYFMMKDKQNDNKNKQIGEFVLLCFLISYVLSTRRTSNLMK